MSWKLKKLGKRLGAAGNLNHSATLDKSTKKAAQKVQSKPTQAVAQSESEAKNKKNKKEKRRAYFEKKAGKKKATPEATKCIPGTVTF